MRDRSRLAVLSISLCLLLVTPLIAQEWMISMVDSGMFMGPGVSIVVDSNCQPYIAYGADPCSLKYATRDSSGWAIEAVDMGRSVDFVSLALSEEDIPHIGCRMGGGDLRYARRDTSGWSIETIDTAVGTWEEYVSISLNSNGFPGISYYDATQGDLKYAEWDESRWIIERVDTTGNVGRYASLAIDEADNPHISYYDVTHHRLKYARRSGSEWLVMVVDTPSHAGERIGWDTSIALDNLGHPHISYRYHDHSLPYENNGLRYARWDGSEWLAQIVVKGNSPDWDTGIGSSLVLDSRDRPRIAFLGSSATILNPALMYVAWDGVEWDYQYIDSFPDPYVTSLSLDAGDNPHVAYVHSYISSGIMYATRPIDVEEDEDLYLARAEIFAENSPNPFKTTTAISYSLPTYSHVRLTVYDTAGRLTNTLVDQFQESGYYSIPWNGTDRVGNKVPSGVYFYRIEAGDYMATRKMVVVR